MIERSLILDYIVLAVYVCWRVFGSDFRGDELMSLVLKRVFSLFINFDNISRQINYKVGEEEQMSNFRLKRGSQIQSKFSS